MFEVDVPSASNIGLYNNKFLYQYTDSGSFSVNVSKTSLLRDLDGLKLVTGGLAICITVFNESGSALRASLASMASALAFLLDADNKIDVGKITLSIVTDGVQPLSSSVVEVFEELGCFLSDLPVSDSDMYIYKNNVSLSTLKEIGSFSNAQHLVENENWINIYEQSREFNKPSSNSEFINTLISPDIQLLLCIKHKNAGKLDSHWWFYHALCGEINPELCFQMDVGTVPVNSAIFEMVKTFRSDGNVGAVASSVFVSVPDHAFNFLDIWQYITFAKCMIHEWPAEMASGYLSVIPGQFSAIRWAAIKYDHNERNPLKVYFKGLGALEPHESILYLAEDRVLCSEIVVRPDSNWKLVYASSASVITDSCHSWSELLRQRKRWCNGYLACRINFLSKAQQYFSDKNRAVSSKLTMSTAVIYHYILLLRDWFFPALLLLSYYDLYVTTSSSIIGNSIAYQYVFCLSAAASILLAAQFFICFRGVLDKFAKGVFLVSCILQGIFIISCMLLMVFFGDWKLNLSLLAFYALALPFTALFTHKMQALSVLKSTIPGIFLLPPVWLMMWMYAICNSHDNSWGTKGLETPLYEFDKIDTIVARKSQYSLFRLRYVITWIISNVVMGAILYYMSAVFGVSSVTAILFLLVLNTLFSLIAAFLVKNNYTNNILAR